MLLALGIIVAICMVGVIWTWTRVAKGGLAFVSVLLDLSSIALYVAVVAYAQAAGLGVPGHFDPPLIALLGVLFCFVAGAFGLVGLAKRERGGLSATSIAAVIGLLWAVVFVPALIV